MDFARDRNRGTGDYSFGVTSRSTGKPLYYVSYVLQEHYRPFSKRFKLRPSNVTYLYRRFVEDNSRTNLERSFVYEQLHAKHLKATDPRDLVFALLGHYSIRYGSTHLRGLCADYTKSVIEVYVDIAIRTLSDAPTLETLNVVQHGRHPRNKDHLATIKAADSKLPSWVSNWNEGQWAHMIGHPSSIFKAAGSSAPVWKFTESRLGLDIEGLEVDAIKLHSKVLYPFNFQFDKISSDTIVHLWRTVCENKQFTLTAKYVNEDSAIEAFLDTLTVCRERTMYGLNSTTSFANGLSYLAEVVSHKTDITLSSELQVLAKKGDLFHWSRSTSSASNRRFARTAKGYYMS